MNSPPPCPAHVVCCQAAEVGLSPGGLARHLINMALFAAGQEPLLPAAPPPALESSAQWAQFTGANDSLRQIAEHMAEQNEELREELETAHHTVRGGGGEGGRRRGRGGGGKGGGWKVQVERGRV